jgi:D-alanyl-lipoteichoic acid acyltransferase DltB (MBOAT superfamily)
MLILLCLFRKCVVADNCALLANAAFGGQLGSNLLATIIGIYAFAWQIYADFSGYSDIARGSAQLFGFHFILWSTFASLTSRRACRTSGGVGISVLVHG